MRLVQDNPLIVTLATLVSIVLTLWAINVDPILNPDATIYLTSAEEFLKGNIKNGFAIYKWPFYSSLIAAFSLLPGVSIETAAYIINGLMHIFIVLGFLACVKALGGNKRTLVIAALLILFFPSFNKYRAFVIRDVGFWAFYLWSLYHIFVGVKTDELKRFIFAFILMAVAFLFRVEAVALILIVSAFLLYSRSADKRVRMIWLFAGLVGGVGLILIAGLWIFSSQASNSQSGLLGSIFNSLELLRSTIEFKLGVIRRNLLNEFSAEMAPLVLIVSMACITIYEPLRRLAFIFAYFSWYALKNNLVLEQKELRRLFYLICIVHILLLFFLTVIVQFLVSRHTMALVLTILLLTPFSLDYFLTKWRQKKGKPLGNFKWVFPFAAVLLLALALDGLDLKTNKLEIKGAGKWVAEQVDSNAHVYSNNPVLLHYAGTRPATYDLSFDLQVMERLLNNKQIFMFDYVVVSVRKRIESTRKFMERKLGRKVSVEKMFDNNRVVFIFDLRDVGSKRKLDSTYFKIPWSH